MAKQALRPIMFSKLNGGQNVSMAPLLVQQDPQGPIQSPDCQNCDFWEIGSVSKRYGKAQQGNAVSAVTSQSQISTDGNDSVGMSSGQTGGVCQKITAAGSNPVVSIKFLFSIQYGGTAPTNFHCEIRADNSGVPGSILTNGTSATLATPPTSPIPVSTVFTFPTPPNLVFGTVYWICVVITTTSNATTPTWSKQSGASNNVKTSNNNFSTVSNASNDPEDMYYFLTYSTTTSAIQGGFNYLKGFALTQKIMAVQGGSLFYYANPNWTTLKTGLNSGATNLWDFSELKGYLFSTDFAGNVPQVWDQSATGTMQMGYRMSSGYANGAFTATGIAGGSLSATGKYNLMAVTSLKSGGFRASIVTGVIPGGGNGTITVANINVNNTSDGTQFGFDVAALATTWFMTLDQTVASNSSLYYKIPTANMSVAANPQANSTTTFNITAPVAGTENTLLITYNLDQTYFVNQNDAPKCKFFKVWQGFLVAGGDPTNTSRVWFPEQYAPNNWSNGPVTDGLHGNFLDINPDDGDVITGLGLINNELVVFKNHSIYLVTYTGNAQIPFFVSKVSSEIGTFSHWSIRPFSHSFYGNTLIFLSENGVGLCYGSFAGLLPEGKTVSAYFDANNSFSFNLASMTVSQAAQDYTTQKIFWLISTNGATNRNAMLVFDYKNMAFTIWQGVADNILFEVTDANLFRQIWSGDYSGNVYRYQTGSDDAGNSISWYWNSPWLSFGETQFYKFVEWLAVAGDIQTAAGAALLCDVYIDFQSTPVITGLSFDMTATIFGSSSYLAINQKCRAIKFKFYNNQLDVPVRINNFTVTANQLELVG